MKCHSSVRPNSQRAARWSEGWGGGGGGGRAKRRMTFQTNLYWIYCTAKTNADSVNKKNRNHCEFESLVQLQTRYTEFPQVAVQKT